MARHEADREDLIREATALRRRVELRVPGEAESVVAGFRSDGSLSVYFGADPVYHFDPHGRLRRAFVGDRLYRTQGETLARLTRVRSETVTELRRHDLDPRELDEFVAAMRSRLRRLCDALADNTATVVRQVPAAEPIAADLREQIERSLGMAEPLAPRIRGVR
jgi:hypothetical protein